MQSISILAHIHSDGQFRLLSSTQGGVPGAEFLSTLLPRMNQSSFQFLPLDSAPGCCAAICCQDNVSYSDDHRPGSMSFALVFPPERVEPLLESPEQLFALMEYMKTLTPPQLLSLVHGEALPQWPSEYKEGPVNNNVCNSMQNVVIRRLGGETCYAMAEGSAWDLLHMLHLLPLSVRKHISFTIPYTRSACSTGLINLVTSVGERFPNLPAIQRYTIGPDTAMPPLPDSLNYLEELIRSLNADPELDKAFCQADSFASWAELAKLHYLMKDALEQNHSQSARELQRSSPESVSLLLSHSSQPMQEHWQALLAQSPLPIGTEQESSTAFHIHPTHTHTLKKVLVLLALIAGLGACLLPSTCVLRAADQLHLIITLSGSNLAALLLGLVWGFGLGFLLFEKEDTP